MSFSRALLTSFKSVLTIATIVALGILLVRRKVIKRPDIGVLAQVMNALFLPCMYLDILGSGLSVELFKNSWQLIVGGLLLQITGFLFGNAVCCIARPEPFFKKWFILAFTFPNVVALPFVLIESICSNEHETLGFTETQQCADKGGVHVFMFILTFSFSMWVLAYEWVKNPAAEKEAVSHDALERALDQDQDQAPAAMDLAKDTEVPVKSSVWLCGVIKRALWKPSVVGQFAGLVVGLTAPLQAQCIDRGGYLRPFMTAVQVMSVACVPVVNLIMAASVGCKLGEIDGIADVLGSRRLGISQRTMLALVLGKCIVLPALQYCLITAVLPFLPESRLVRLIFFFEPVGPTAAMVVVLAQIHKQQRAAEILAYAIMPQLLLSVPSISIFVGYALYITSK